MSTCRRPGARAAELAGALPVADYWTSVLTDDSIPAEETWTHLWASAVRLHGEEPPRVLRLVADGVISGIIITAADMGWLYAPYDGGADVITASPGHRDQLRRAHEDWLSAHPAGTVTLGDGGRPIWATSWPRSKRASPSYPA